MTGVPTMMLDLMKHPDWSPHKVASLKNVVAGGAPVPPSQVTEMRAKSKKVTSSQGYGLTETFAIGTLLLPQFITHHHLFSRSLGALMLGTLLSCNQSLINDDGDGAL